MRFSNVATLSLLFFGIGSAFAQDLDIDKFRDSLGFRKAVPVFVSGYSGEVDQVLRFDLSFMGFDLVNDKNAARYLIQKNNAAGVGAQVTDPLANKIPYNKVFNGPGSTPRQQAHALADDLSQVLLRM